MCYAQRIWRRELKGGSEITDIVLYKRQKREKKDFDRRISGIGYNASFM